MRATPGKLLSLQYRIRYKDGAWRWLDVTAHSLFSDPSMQALVVNFRDITERKQKEELSKRSEAYLAESQRISRLGSWAINISTREIVFWSKEHYRIFGFDPEDGIPPLQVVLGRIHPEDRPMFEHAFKNAIRERRNYESEFRIVLPDGTLKFCHSIGHPVVNKSGDLTELTGTVMDVTERKRAEEELQRSFEQLRALAARLQSVREEERTRLARNPR